MTDNAIRSVSDIGSALVPLAQKVSNMADTLQDEMSETDRLTIKSIGKALDHACVLLRMMVQFEIEMRAIRALLPHGQGGKRE